MSLLIPSKVDYDDAHPVTNHFQEYATLLSQQPQEDFSWKFEVVPGFFMQSEESTDDLKFRYTEQHFGLMLDSWSELIKQVHALNESAASNECYKVLFWPGMDKDSITSLWGSMDCQNGTESGVILPQMEILFGGRIHT